MPSPEPEKSALASIAGSKDGNMLELSVEVVLGLQLVSELVEHVDIDVPDLAAFAAHQVVMLRFPSRMIEEAPATQVRLSHQTIFFQEFQSPINSGDVNIGILETGPGMDFFGTDVIMASFDGFQHHHTLGSKAVAFFSQNPQKAFLILHLLRPVSVSIIGISWLNVYCNRQTPVP